MSGRTPQPPDLVTLEEVALTLGCSERRARALLTQGGVSMVRAYRADAVARFLADREADPQHAALPFPDDVVPPDAQLPEVLIHEPTGWQVHPSKGMVYSLHATRAPQLLGSPNTKTGHLRSNRKYPNGKRVNWQISHVVWEAVNKRMVPDGWVIKHRNGDHLDNRYSNLVISREGHYVGREARDRKTTRS